MVQVETVQWTVQRYICFIITIVAASLEMIQVYYYKIAPRQLSVLLIKKSPEIYIFLVVFPVTYKMLYFKIILHISDILVAIFVIRISTGWYWLLLEVPLISFVCLVKWS